MTQKPTYEVLEKRIQELEHAESELEWAEDTLRETQKYYQRLVEGLGDDFLIYSHKLDGTITYVSPGIESIFGVSKEEIIGSNWMKKVNWESRDLERAGKNINDMVSGIEYRRIEMSFRHPDGKQRTVFISPHPIKNIDGSVVSIEGIVEDITDRKRVEEEREKLIKELQAALNEIKTLRGILPLCSFCKKVRDDKGYWEQVDVYIHKHSQADISHSICPDCAKEHYPDLDIYDD